MKKQFTKLLAVTLLSLLSVLSVNAITYYSTGSVDPTVLANWNSNRDGSGGTTPSNFSTSSDIFIVQGTGNGGTTPHTMTNTTAWVIGTGVTVEIENGATLIASSSGASTAQITFPSGSTFKIDAGGTYNHSCTGGFSTLFGGTESFAATSNFILNPGNTLTGPSTVTCGSSFGNLTWTNGTGSMQCNGVLPNIAGNLTINGTAELRLAGSTASPNLTIGGDLNIQTGIFSFGNASATGGVINVGGNFSMSGGTLLNSVTGGTGSVPVVSTINFNKSGVQTFTKSAGTITAASSSSRHISMVVLSGSTLDMGTNILNCAGSTNLDFTVNSGGTVRLGDPGGIVVQGTSAGTGNIQTSSTSIRSFSTSGNYEYTGVAAQVTGSGLPATVNNLTINNTAGVTLSSNTTAATLTNNASSILNVPAGKQLTVSTTLTNNGTLNLLSDDANGTATILTLGTLGGGGTYNVNQYLIGSTGIPPRNWWYISSPVTGVGVGNTSAVFSPAGAGVSGNKMGYYDEAHAGGPAYVQILDGNTTLSQGKGYAINLSTGDATYTFTGPLNNDIIDLTLTRTGITAGKRGFNLVGNPYPSYLDWNAVTKSNMRSMIWYRTITSGGTMQFDTWDGSSTGTGNGINGNVTQYIPPMQAFWARVDVDDVGGFQSTGTLQFTNTMRSHQDMSSATNRLRVRELNQTPILRFKVSNGINADEAIVINDPNASNDYDQFDADKMSNGDVNIPEIFTLAGSQEIVINHMNTISESTELPLGFRPGQSNTFTIRSTEFSNFVGLKVILKDKLLGTEQDMTDGTAYNFSSDATATNDRFSIVFKAKSGATGLDNTSNKGGVLVYRNLNNHIAVICNDEINDQSSVSVYNAVGQKMSNQKLTKITTEINQALTAGVYVVTVHNGGQTVTKKVIIK